MISKLIVVMCIIDSFTESSTGLSRNNGRLLNALVIKHLLAVMLDRSLQTLPGDQKPAKQNASLINRFSTRRKDRSRQYSSSTRVPSSVTSSAGSHSAVAVEMMKSRFGSQHLHKMPSDLSQTGKNGQTSWSVVITTNFTF